jgi:hypothetical protein
VRDAMIAAWSPQETATRQVAGIVRDPAGKPVADALVVAGGRIIADSSSVWFPIAEAAGMSRTTRTLADGTFTLELARGDELVIAQRGPLRSRAVIAADHLELVVVPTRTLDGNIALGGTPSTRVRIWAAPAEWASEPGRGRAYTVAGPLASDGSFHLAGVPRGPVVMSAYVMGDGTEADVTSARVPASDGPARVEMALPGGDRSVTVLVRSTLSSKLDAASLILVSGVRTFHGVPELLDAENGASCRRAMAGQASELASVPADKLRPDDLAARFDHLSDGMYTVCAIGLNDDLIDSESTAKLWAHPSDMKLGCKTFRSDAGIVIVEAPPQRRID